MRVASRAGLIRVALLLLVLTTLSIITHSLMIRMPGTSYRGPLPSLTAREARYRDELARDLHMLAGEIGERNVFVAGSLDQARSFLETELRKAGFAPSAQEFIAVREQVANVEVELRGSRDPAEIVVIGAHYDSVAGSPGANDNGTGAVAVLALARAFAERTPGRTLRFVLFVNEEPPFFQRHGMGSLEYAARCRERSENIVAMVSLETMGHFDDTKGSQKYPAPFGLFYPDTGNFIAFVGNTKSGKLVRRCVRTFREKAKFPSEGVATVGGLPGIGWSDHWSFWEHGYPGVMVTDTAPFRYPHYHEPTDTPERIDYDRLARVVAGLEDVVDDLVHR